MKISTLLRREPFDKIFEKTLASFLEDFTKRPHIVKWGAKNKFNKALSTAQQWHCNPLINSVFVKGVNPNVYNSINGEYSYNPLRPWRSFLQRMYLVLSQSKLTAVFMSKFDVNITPAIEDAENKLIIGGNKKIRLIDIANKKVYVILKQGFDKKYLEKEIFVRHNFSFLPIPKIDLYGSNNLWYSEEYIIGIPPNRIEGHKSKEILFKAIRDIRKMLDKTKRNILISEYAISLQGIINDDIDQTPHIDINIKKRIKIIASKLSAFLVKQLDKKITIAYCHGDFHQGNILSNGDDYWILDWENSGEKQIGYDLFILLFGSRVDKGFSNKFISLLNNELKNDRLELVRNWPEVKLEKTLKTEYLIAFLMEDLIFYIEENNNILFYNNQDVLNTRCVELETIINQIKL